jgi:hypothetical protein
MKSIRTHTVLILAVLLALGSLGMYAFLFKVMEDTNTRIVALTTEASSHEQTILEAQSLRKVASEIGPSIEKVDSYYISKDGGVAFIEMIQELGRESGVVTEISSAKYVDAIASTTEKLHLSVVFEGTWKDDMHFLSQLETLPYDLSIKNIAFTGNLQYGEPGNKVPRWRAAADIEVTKLYKK